MPDSGTFDYVVTVPSACGEGSFPWFAELHRHARFGGPFSSDSRLVGPSPRLHIRDAGATEWTASRPFEPPLPRMDRSRLTLTAAGRRDATVAEASFYVDARLIGRLRPGDVMHLARTACGGLALSVVRGTRLVVAVGAVTDVPLGSDVDARIPWELIEQAEVPFRTQDPSFAFCECPVEVCVEGERHFLCREECRFGSYEVVVHRGYLRGMPGTDACVAIFRKGECGDLAASYSAVLLGSGGLEMDEWPSP